MRGSGLVDGLSNNGPWRAIAERLVESYAVNRDLLVLFDNNEIQSAKDFMKALGKRCIDASAFRALADMAIQSLPSEDKFSFTKAARFQEMSLFRDTINAQQLASCLHDLDGLGLKNEQRDNAMKLANEIGSKQGFGTVDSNLVLNSTAGDVAQTALQAKEPLPSHDPVNPANRPFEFENPISQQSSLQPLPQSVFSADQSSRDHPDLTRFMIARDIQMRASGPAEKAMTSLERAALLDERKDSPGMPVSGMDRGIDGSYGQNQGYRSANGSLNDRPVLDGKQDERIGSPDRSSISDEAIERIKSFFASALGIERRQPFGRDDGPDFQGKGPSSSPPIKHVPIIKPIVSAAGPSKKTFALPLQPPEPLTFRLRGGRFVTANSIAAIANGSLDDSARAKAAAEKPPVLEKKAAIGLMENKKSAIGHPDDKSIDGTLPAVLSKSIKKKEKRERIGIIARQEAEARSARKKSIASDHGRNEKTRLSHARSRAKPEIAATRRTDASSPGHISKPDNARRGKSKHPVPPSAHAHHATSMHGSMGHPRAGRRAPGKHDNKHGSDHGKDIKSGAKAAAQRKKRKASRQRNILMQVEADRPRKKSGRALARK